MSKADTSYSLWADWERQGRLPLDQPVTTYERWLSLAQSSSASPADIGARPWVMALCYHGLGLDDQTGGLWQLVVGDADRSPLGRELLARIALRRGLYAEALRLAEGGFSRSGEPGGGGSDSDLAPTEWTAAALALTALLFMGRGEDGLALWRRFPEAVWTAAPGADMSGALLLAVFGLAALDGRLDRTEREVNRLHELALAYRSDMLPAALTMYALTDILQGRLSSAAERIRRAYAIRDSLTASGQASWLDEAVMLGWRLVSPFGQAPAQVSGLAFWSPPARLASPSDIFCFSLESMGRLLRGQPIERLPTPEEGAALPAWLSFLRRQYAPDVGPEHPPATRGWGYWHRRCKQGRVSALDEARLQGWLDGMDEVGRALRARLAAPYATGSVPAAAALDMDDFSPQRFLAFARATNAEAWVLADDKLLMHPPSDSVYQSYLEWQRSRRQPPGWLTVEIGRQAYSGLGAARLALEHWQTRRRLAATEEEVLRLSRRLAPATIVARDSGDESPQLPLSQPLIGDSSAMRELRVLLQTLREKKSDVPVLITGETGTGKEVVARALHDISPRSRQRFLALNCGAFSRELLPSELFGHVKGAFTGAVENRLGAIREAGGGTLFLDEIGEMPLDQQVVLLRWLESGEVRPLGSAQTYKSEARLITATNRDLRDMAEQKSFREDLYARLKVLVIHLPPLRERKEDIPLLAQHFLRAQGGGTTLTQAALDKLLDYRWPGNIRELRSVIASSLALLPPGRTVLDAPSLMLDQMARREVAERPSAVSLASPGETETCLVDLTAFARSGRYRAGLDAAGLAMLDYMFPRCGSWDATYGHFPEISPRTLFRLRRRSGSAERSENKRPSRRETRPPFSGDGLQAESETKSP